MSAAIYCSGNRGIRMAVMSREAKKQQNIDAISASFEMIRDQCGRDNAVSIPLTLLLSRTTHALLSFEIGTVYNERIGVVADFSLHKNNTHEEIIARRVASFEPDQKKKVVRIFFHSDTNRGYEGYGLGTGLFGVSDRVIPYVVSLYDPDLFAGLAVISYVIDNAEHKASAQEGWSAYCADLLGYKPDNKVDGVTFVKRFR